MPQSRAQLDIWPDEPSLLPFLDIVFTTIGILVVVFALQDINARGSARPPTVDQLILCREEHQVLLFADPETPEPMAYAIAAFPQLLERLLPEGGSAHNLVFALTGDCFGARQHFEDALTRFGALPSGGGAEAEALARRVAPRVVYWPLSAQPDAEVALLARWRGGELARQAFGEPAAQ